MDKNDKAQRLRKISQEANLREVLMNLFDRMGLQPVLTHGSIEHGKDIVCCETNAFSVTEWSAFVVKRGKITGATSGSASLQTILNQVSEAFIHPYADAKSARKVRINKVFVVSNDEILPTAREKIPEKAASLPNGAAPNISFMDGADLVTLLDEYWPEFWDTRSEVLAVNDLMSVEVGKTLYVIALAFTLHERQTKKKSAYLTKVDIVRQTGLNEATVETALAYLVQRQYLDPPSETEGYTLHRKLTAGRLLTKQNQIELLFLLDKTAKRAGHLSLHHAIDAAKKQPHDFTPKFVRDTMGVLLKGGYVDADDGHGKNHFLINVHMLQDEKAYLECWTQFKGAFPRVE